MAKLNLVVIGMMLVLVSAAKPKPSTRADDRSFDVQSSYSKVDDTTTVAASFLFAKSSGTMDTLRLSYTFPGKKQTVYLRPRWGLWLYDRSDRSHGSQIVRVLANGQGPAERLELRFAEHDSQFGGDSFTAELQKEMEIILVNAKTLEFIPPSAPMAGSCKLSAVQTNALKNFLKDGVVPTKSARY